MWCVLSTPCRLACGAVSPLHAELKSSDSGRHRYAAASAVISQALHVCRLQYEIRAEGLVHFITSSTASDERARPGNEATVVLCVHTVQGLDKHTCNKLHEPD